MKQLSKLFIFLLIVSNSYGQLSPLHLDNSIIKDGNNRTIILNGCVTITHHANGFQIYTLNDYKRLKSWGANYQSIRLHAASIGADGSPTSPVSYQVLDSMVSRAKQVGIYTEFKLTLYGGTPYNWENLWLNVGNSQQNLIDGWQSVWARYVNEPAVIGYDLINEPKQGNVSTPNDSIFVCNYLNPLYQKLIDSLQTIDTNKFAFIQPTLGEFNPLTGIAEYYEYPCAINRIGVVYAPHLFVKISYPYDLSGFPARMARYVNESKLHNAPLFIGEYGIPWYIADDGNLIKEQQYSITEKLTIGLYDSLKIGFSRPWFADDNAEVSGNQLNWALIKGTTGLTGSAREFILNGFSRPYPKMTAGNLLSYKFHFSQNRFIMTYTSSISSSSTEIFTAQKRYFNDTLVLQYNNSCFILDTVMGIFQVINNPDNINPANFIWDDQTQTITINEWANATNTVQLLNSMTCTPLGINQTENLTKYKLYPNPTKDILIVERKDSPKEELNIFDTHGRLVKTEMLLTPKSYIDISNLTLGVFFVRIGTNYHKIIKK